MMGSWAGGAADVGALRRRHTVIRLYVSVRTFFFLAMALPLVFL